MAKGFDEQAPFPEELFDEILKFHLKRSRPGITIISGLTNKGRWLGDLIFEPGEIFTDEKGRECQKMKVSQEFRSVKLQIGQAIGALEELRGACVDFQIGEYKDPALEKLQELVSAAFGPMPPAIRYTFGWRRQNGAHHTTAEDPQVPGQWRAFLARSSTGCWETAYFYQEFCERY